MPTKEKLISEIAFATGSKTVLCSPILWLEGCLALRY